MSGSTDPDLLDKVLARDLLNIQKRVAAGEPITSAEREVLKQARGTGNSKEPTQAALARALGIHRQRLHRYTKLPGFPVIGPDGYDVATVKEWIRANGFADPEDDGEDIESAKLRKIRAEADLAERKRDEIDQKTVPIEAVLAAWSQAMVATRQTVLAMSWLKDDARRTILDTLADIPVGEYFRRAIASEQEKEEAEKEQAKMQAA